jgi:hypothetical protein
VEELNPLMDAPDLEGGEGGDAMERMRELDLGEGKEEEERKGPDRPGMLSESRHTAWRD